MHFSWNEKSIFIVLFIVRSLNSMILMWELLTGKEMCDWKWVWENWILMNCKTIFANEEIEQWYFKHVNICFPVSQLHCILQINARYITCGWKKYWWFLIAVFNNEILKNELNGFLTVWKFFFATEIPQTLQKYKTSV